MDEAEKSRAMVSITPWQPRTATPLEDAHARVVDTVQSPGREPDCKCQVNTTILPFQEVKLTHSDSAESRESWTAGDERCCRYRDMIDNAQSVLLMKLAQGLRQQDSADAEKGRVAVLEYNAEGKPSRKDFKTSQQLLQYLDQEERPVWDSQPNAVPTPGVRRLFILEDLSRRHVEILGSRLKIHPIHFARHWGDMGFLESIDDFQTTKHRTSRLTLPFPIFLNAPTVANSPRRPLEELYLANFNVRRVVAFPKPFGSWDLRSSIIEMECCISYWSQPTENGGWDALVMVDPPMNDKLRFFSGDLSQVQCTPDSNSTLDLVLSEEADCIPNWANQVVLPTDPKDWGNAELRIRFTSIFEKVIAGYLEIDIKAGEKPFVFTKLARRIALEKWNKFLNHAIHCLVLTKGEPYSNNSHFNSPISTLWAQTNAEWLLARMVKWSRRLATEHTTVNTIMRGLGMNLHDRKQNGVLDNREAEQWRYIDDKILEYKSLYDDCAASYIQVMALREAQNSNMQAKSVGRITLVAALFVPVSLISGIMSMGGEFIPGGKKFWVFFAVAAPVIALVYMFLCTQLLEWTEHPIRNLRKVLKRKEEALLPRFFERDFHERF